MCMGKARRASSSIEMIAWRIGEIGSRESSSYRPIYFGCMNGNYPEPRCNFHDGDCSKTIGADCRLWPLSILSFNSLIMSLATWIDFSMFDHSKGTVSKSSGLMRPTPRKLRSIDHSSREKAEGTLLNVLDIYYRIEKRRLQRMLPGGVASV